MPDYAVYGLTVRLDRALAGLREAESRRGPDVRVHAGTSPPWADRLPAPDGLLYRAPEGEMEPPVVEATWLTGRPGLRLRYEDGTVFHVAADASEVWAGWPAPLTAEDMAVYLLGPVLGYVLRRLGVLSLHASGVVIAGRAAAFCGPSGTGKSTIAAAAAAGGQRVLSDDVLALRDEGGETLAYPAYDHLRVWDDAAHFLVGEAQSLPLLTPNWDKRAFPVEALGYTVAREPAPLGWIFLLAEREASDAAPRVELLRAVDAFVPLVGNTSANYLLDASMRAQEFAHVSRVLERTPVFRLVPHADPSRLPALIERVLEVTGG